MKILLYLAEPPLFWTPGVNSFGMMLLVKSCSVAKELGSKVRSRENILSLYMSSIATMLLLTCASR